MSRLFVAGATGTIGRALVRALVRRGDSVVAWVRPPAPGRPRELPAELFGSEVRAGEIETGSQLLRDGLRWERFDAVFSCLASRTGGVEDAWRVDHRANLALLEASRAAGVPHFVLLSAICVQRPRLAFQHAKLAFEAALRASGSRYSIVRPTAYFKSLAGQVERVRRGKPFAVFGDGTLTACKPISDGDLADFLAGCLSEPARWDRVLPIGGPGPALTPRDQAALLSQAFGRPVRLARVPVAVLDGAVAVLSAAARALPGFADKAEYARIGRYYATESMLVWDEVRGRYDAEATPSTGSETLGDFYARLAQEGAGAPRLGAHAFFREGR